MVPVAVQVEQRLPAPPLLSPPLFLTDFGGVLSTPHFLTDFGGVLSPPPPKKSSRGWEDVDLPRGVGHEEIKFKLNGWR